MERGRKAQALRGFWLPLMLLSALALAFLAVCGGQISSTPLSEGSETHRSVLAGLAGHLETGIAKVEPLLQRYGYAAVFLAIFVEGFGILAPGQTLLMAGALASARGDLSFAWLLLSALAAAILGNLIGYVIGRWGGRPLLRRVRLNESHLARVESYFSRRGGTVLLVARFFDGLRQLHGIVAGVLGMPWRKFLPLNALGAVLWTGVWGVGVYELDRRIILLHRRFVGIQPIALTASIAALIALVVYVVWRHRGKQGPPDL